MTFFSLKFLLPAFALAMLVYCYAAKAGTVSFRELLARPRPLATHQLAYGDDPNQFGELWLPEGNGPFPVVIMIHGGCWQAALPGVELMAYMAEDLRLGGVAVWNLEYRRLGHRGGGYPGTFADIANGVDYLRQISATYGLDTSHIVITGHSAGGHLALWAAARSGMAQSSALYREHPLTMQAAITLAGINDLAAYRAKGPSACGGPRTIDRLVGAGTRENPYADTSPAAMLPLHVPQVIISGDADPIVPAPFGDAYGKAAKAAGDKVEVIELPDSGHFELIDPESDAWVTIKRMLLSHLK